MIKTETLHFAYPTGDDVLKGITLEIGDSEFVAIMGENGAGKTTLIKHFNGLHKPTKGHVLVDDVDTRKRSVASISRDVGLVFQNPDHQLFCETVREEVAFSLRNFGYEPETIERRTKNILETLDLSQYADSSPFTLSGGERKRVALASVLVWNPKHVVLDEPTIGQDYQQKDRLRNFILQLVSQRKTVIIVTHDIEFVAECKPRVILLSKGSIVADGPARKILTDERLLDECSLVRPQISSLMSSLNDLGLGQDIIDVYTARASILEAFRRVK